MKACVSRAALLTALAFTPAVQSAPEPLQLQRITPAGEDVEASRQIVFQFNRAVVPLGRMQRESAEIPIAIEPALACRWRWLDATALACELDEAGALKPATRYTVSVNPGIAAEDGATLAAPVTQQFITERPKVREAWFANWAGPGRPQLRVSFNLPVAQGVVQQHLFFKVAGDTGSRVPVEALLEDEPEHGVRNYWLVRAAADLPPDVAIELWAEAGLKSESGPEAGIESGVVNRFHTFGAFEFKGVRCYRNIGDAVLMAGPTADKCDPLRSAALVFSSPPVHGEVKRAVKITPDLAGGRKDFDPWGETPSYSQLWGEHQKDQTYEVWLPGKLLAEKTYGLQGTDLKDEFGRTLANPIDMRFLTDSRRPDFVLTHPYSVLEKGEQTETPIVLTNLKALSVFYDRLGIQGAQRGLSRQIALPEVHNIAWRRPLDVRAMLEDQPGAVLGRIESRPILAKTPQDRWFFAQITPFQVHVKAAHRNSLVWVTDLKTGMPVADARVEILEGRFAELSSRSKTLAEGKTDAQGLVDLPGLADLDPQLSMSYTYEQDKPRLFVRVLREGDFALLPLTEDFRLEVFRVAQELYASHSKRYGHVQAWGTTAQGVYRLGDLVQYKFYVRDQGNAGLIAAPNQGYKLEVFDAAGKSVHVVPKLALNGFGAYAGEFRAPETGAVGWYRFELSAAFLPWPLEPLRVLVSDFTPAPFKVTLDLAGQTFQPGETLKASVQAKLHAGGPYALGRTRFSARLDAQQLTASGAGLHDFQFDTWPVDQQRQFPLHETQATLDAQGTLPVAFEIQDTPLVYGNLNLEAAVEDERGKSVTGFAHAAYFGRDRYVGLRPTSWMLESGKPGRFEVLVLGANQKPVSGTAVEVLIERQETRAARVKGPGDAYLTRYEHEWKLAGSCRLRSRNTAVTCQFTPKAPGEHRVTAMLKDTRGRAHQTQLQIYALGQGDVIWGGEGEDYGLKLVAEQDEFKVGDTARYLVKNSLPGAQALVSVERYGVLKRWVQTLPTATEVIEFKVEPDFLPGFYVSVVAMSPRIEKAPPLAVGDPDLGKPVVRMGYAQGKVVDPYKGFDFAIKTDKPSYRPRDTVKLSVSAKPRHAVGEEPVELAVVVLDEAVFDLNRKGREYYDPLAGFNSVDGLDLNNYNLLLRLIGRQKFEKKGANPGGDGGAGFNLRSLFKYVAYWNPSIELASGESKTLEFEAPDNLTGWRVLVMAVTPTDRMGLGDAQFVVNRPTELRAVMPNQVIEGDRFDAGFSVLNRTDQARELEVAVKIDGPLQQGAEPVARALSLAPWERTTLWFPIKTKAPGQLSFVASARDALDVDGLSHTLLVQPLHQLETVAIYGRGQDVPVTLPVAVPPDVLPGASTLSVNLSPSILGSLDGAFAYLRDYPYSCWEQKITTATMAAQMPALRGHLSPEFEWPGHQQRVQEVLDRAGDYQAPNGGMSFYQPQDTLVSPYLSAYTALAFGWLRAEGANIPQPVEQRLLAYLQKLLREDLPQFNGQPALAVSVRAVALAALAEWQQALPEDVERLQLQVGNMSAFAQAQLLKATLKLNGPESIRDDLVQRLRARMHETSGQITFTGSQDDVFGWMLETPQRAACATLSAFTGIKDDATADVALKLARSVANQRGEAGAWRNTQEALFCTRALLDFSRRFETESPHLRIMASLDDKSMGEAAFASLRDPAQMFSKPLAAAQIGHALSLTLMPEGKGAFYHVASLVMARSGLHDQSRLAGLEVRRRYSVQKNQQWVPLAPNATVQVGDRVRVDLELSSPGLRRYVVLDDRLPGGLEPVNADLATASQFDVESGSTEPDTAVESNAAVRNAWRFYHRELRHDAARFYADELPAGTYKLSYAAQAIASGDFQVPPAHAEAMYEPDVHGDSAGFRLRIKPQADLPAPADSNAATSEKTR